MSMINDFIASIQKTHAGGKATEHSYRPALKELLSSLGRGVSALNEPKRIACGAPDFIIQQGDLVIGYLEAKDLDVDLRGMGGANREQLRRYLAALPNLIYTNCLQWDLYRDGELADSVAIAEWDDTGERVAPKPDQYARLEKLLGAFIAARPMAIATPQELAGRMAGKANLIKEVLGRALLDDKSGKNGESELHNQYLAFRENLIQDIEESDFADIYAETIAYGMFAARLHDPVSDSFSRRKALDLLPKSNPFLRSLFRYIVDDLDDRIAWIIDDLAHVFAACDIKKIMEGFGELTGRHDPFLHFYETFLTAYDPQRRKACGVWYTPEAVVHFIVRSVDEMLRAEFGLADGLADTSKVTVDWDTGQTDKKGKAITTPKQVHRVQILDPAAGTGTFLAEVVKQIAPRIKQSAPSMWSQYIERELIPRLHGFELLMASYAMCHTKIDMILTELSYKPQDNPPRLSVYLTNSLEEGAAVNRALPFAQWLSREAEGANAIKRDMPIMCVIGNPPYLAEAGKAAGWIGRLMEDYKKEPGGKKKLQERNPKWLNDLYVRFIRMSSHLIEKNGEGVLGFITNHGYLDNPTFRGMRWHLLKTFDAIHVLDLHGNAKKREKTPGGKPDKNVFDIQQGVAIIVAVKKSGDSGNLAAVRHGDLWGATREEKHDALYNSGLAAVTQSIDSLPPQYPFVPRDDALRRQYNEGFGVDEFMPINSVGIVTARDNLCIQYTRDDIEAVVADFASLETEAARQKYNLGADTRDWKAHLAQQDLIETGSDKKLVRPIAYRPFDVRYTYYTGNTKGFICMARDHVMSQLLNGKNACLATTRSVTEQGGFNHAMCYSGLSEGHMGNNIAYVFPLYLHPAERDLDKTRNINFKPELYEKMRRLASRPPHGAPDEWAVFDYLYGVLHCPAYREAYAEFLRIDFPRIPWPKTPDEFWAVAEKGAMLRKLHLMDPAAIGDAPYPFLGEGDATVENPRCSGERAWINQTQYFDNIPEAAWDFHIGGYQPAQKWLKDRKGRRLDWNDIQHYQGIIKILSETNRLMRGIDMILG